MTSTSLPFAWSDGNPPEPGLYETITILSRHTDREGCTTYNVRRVTQAWDGERWAQSQPSGWRVKQ